MPFHIPDSEVRTVGALGALVANYITLVISRPCELCAEGQAKRDFPPRTRISGTAAKPEKPSLLAAISRFADRR